MIPCRPFVFSREKYSFAQKFYCPMSGNHLKEALYQFCRSFVQKRIAGIQSTLKDLRESLGAEDKNTSGDKHETGRAMLQLEQEKLGQQLYEAEKMQENLGRVDFRAVRTVAGTGSLVRTTKNTYFLAISAGKFKGPGRFVYCISLGTPMGQLLQGKTVGDTVHFNGEDITILEVT